MVKVSSLTSYRCKYWFYIESMGFVPILPTIFLPIQLCIVGALKITMKNKILSPNKVI